jgi:hypothetical protein
VCEGGEERRREERRGEERREGIGGLRRFGDCAGALDALS